MAIKDRKSVTKRDFELISNNNASREVDLTVSFSPKYEWIIIEVMSVDNLNKIIDSSKDGFFAKNCCEPCKNISS